MKSVIVEAPGAPLTVQSVPTPEPVEGELLLRLSVATICALTDLGTLDGWHPPHKSAIDGMLPHDLRIHLRRHEGDPSRPFYPSRTFGSSGYPAALGHEAAGQIVAFGPDANSAGRRVRPDRPLSIGERVGTYRLHGAYSEYAAIDTENVFSVPEFMSDEEASLIEPLIANYNCLKRCWTIRPAATVVVIGQGCQGLLATQACRALGASWICVVEPSAYKRRLALTLGADLAIDPTRSNVVHEVERLTSGRGADLVVECVGAEETIRSIPFLVRRGGIVGQIGACTKPITFDYGYVHFKHFIVVPADYFENLCAVAEQVAEVIDLIDNGKIKLGPLITHRLSLADVPAAFDLIRARPDDLIKIAVSLS